MNAKLRTWKCADALQSPRWARTIAVGGWAVVAAGLFASPVHAADTEGFFVEASVNTNHLGGTSERQQGDSPDDVFIGENAPGGTVILAYGLTPSFALRAAVSGADHESTEPDVDFHFSSLSIEASYIFRTGSEVRPYLYGGLGIFSLDSTEGSGFISASPNEADYEFETNGPGMDFGGGLYSFIGEHFVFDAGLRFDLISWDKETAEWTLGDGTKVSVNNPVDEDGTAAKLLLGAGWWF